MSETNANTSRPRRNCLRWLAACSTSALPLHLLAQSVEADAWQAAQDDVLRAATQAA